MGVKGTREADSLKGNTRESTLDKLIKLDECRIRHTEFSFCYLFFLTHI